MSNEITFILTAIGIFGFIRYCFFQGRRWLHASIVINLILISVFGAKLIYAFGLVTNVGNIFYAAVFFAGQLLVEHYGKKEGQKSVWLGLVSVAFFVLIGQLTVRYAGIPEAAEASKAIDTLFKFIPRVALASLVAYFFAQSLNIVVYSRLRQDRESKIWKRSILATAAGQLLDSLIFFSIAFMGTISQTTLSQSMLAGFAVKFSLGVISIPFLYSSYTVKTKREILEQEAEAILSGIGDGLVVTDRNGKILTVNKAFEEMLGWKDNEVVGKQLTDIVKRYDEEGNIVPFKERVLTRVLEGEKVATLTTNHSYFLKKDGTKFPVRIVVTPVIIDQSIMGAVEIFQDVTQEKEIETLRSDFLSLASHQLRTPLSGTRWVIETLKRGVVGKLNKKQNKYLDDLYQINNRMIQMASDMLTTLRIESGNIKITKERFSFAKLYEEIVTMLQPAAKERKISIESFLKEHGSITIETDFKLVKNIIESFVSNSINYSHGGGKVMLDVEDRDNEIVFSVKDSGIGIPIDEQKRIFERFYRASNASLVKTDGTGLGLYISSVLAQKIGAKITFESVKDEGSTFYLHIPKSVS